MLAEIVAMIFAAAEDERLQCLHSAGVVAVAVVAAAVWSSNVLALLSAVSDRDGSAFGNPPGVLHWRT